MATLNYAKTYAEVLGELGIDNLLDLEQVKEIIPRNLVKLFFTGEGDIITHGINYLPLFTQSATGKGLVPNNTSGDIKLILRGSGVWQALATSDLPMWTPETGYTDNTLLSSLQISQLISLSFIANEAMRFKGVISWNETTLKWNVVTVDDPSTVKEVFPVAADIGDTYRIGNDSKQVDYAELKGSTGDLMICIKAYSNLTENQGNSKDYWTIVETNINGYSANTINGVTHQLYSNNPENRFSIYAPSTAGVEGQMLFSVGSDNPPKWGTLQFTGLDSSTAWSNNGIPTRTITLLPASTTVFGGVKIGANISVSKDGTISITQQDVIAALGGANIGGATYDIVSDTAAGLAPKIEAGLIITGQLFLVLGTGDGKTPSWYSLPVTAFSDTWREILVGGASIESKKLNFMPSEDIYIKIGDLETNTSDVYDISFGISWYNISDKKYETA